jgi:hypothetical protein
VNQGAADPTASRAGVLKALLRARRVSFAWPASEHGVVLGRYPQGRDQLAPQSGPETVLPPSAPTARFVDNGGLVLKDLKLWLIYWGSAWATYVSPTAAEITQAVQQMMGSTYFSGLGQYRGIRPPTFGGAIQVTDRDPPSPFSNAAITTMLYEQLGKGALPEPDEEPSILYCVVLPPNVNADEPGVVGEHSFFVYYDLTALALPPDYDVARAHYAWVTNDGTLDSITTVLSHQLAESCTDPNGDGIQGVPGTCSPGAWCEIGDVCAWSEVRDGVRVQAYWSEADQACIVPGVAVSAPLPAVPSRNGEAAISVSGPAEGAPPRTASPTPSPARRGWGFGAQYAGGLLATAWLLPIMATVITVGAYVAPNLFPPDWKLLSDSPVLAGPAIGLLLWLLLAAAYSPMASARQANGGSYADLTERLVGLDARLAAVPAASRTSAFGEASQHRDFIAAELESKGPRWIAAVGYIMLWQRLHRAEEALVDIEPRSQVVADSLNDEMRLQDSTIDHHVDLVADLESARQYLMTQRVADGAATSGIRSETQARALLRQVRYAIDDFRDKRRAGLVKATNLLMGTMIITELFAFALLALAVVNGAPRGAVVAGIVFYLVGALVGLFNRLAQQATSGTMVEDYSLAGVGLVLTPTLSGLAAVGGVALTGMLAMSGVMGLVQPNGSTSAAAPVAAPMLADIFDLNKFRIGLLIAALFGGTPALLSGRLRQLTQQYQKDLNSTDPMTSTPSKQP